MESAGARLVQDFTLINIVVPMAGLGSRFDGTGEERIKALIQVVPGKRMIEYVIDYLTVQEPHRFIFICQKQHADAFDFETFLRSRTRACQIVIADGLTRGPAASAMLAEHLIDNDEELIVAYCDCFLIIDVAEFVSHARQYAADGAVITYPSQNPFHSYAQLDEAGRVLRTAEKQVISDTATAGIYYFRNGRLFVDACRSMTATAPDDRSELFVCPAYNELIRAGMTVLSRPITIEQRMEMGTPEDLAATRRLLAGDPGPLAAMETVQ